MARTKCAFCGGLDGEHTIYCDLYTRIGDMDMFSDSNQDIPYKGGNIEPFESKLAKLCQYLDAIVLLEVVLDSQIELKNMLKLQQLYIKLLERADGAINDLNA